MCDFTLRVHFDAYRKYAIVFVVYLFLLSLLPSKPKTTPYYYTT